MKFIHISDLHIGKRVNNFSMLEDQKYILDEIVGIIENEKPDAVLVAGDIYDKSVASAEAVTVFDEFLTRLNAENGPDIFIISGNHDSGERISFASKIMANEGIYISGVFDGSVKSKTYNNRFKTVVYYLPFVRPAEVRVYYPDADIRDYNDALRTVIGNIEIDQEAVNILICHQFVSGGITSESEEYSVGGLDNVDAKVFGPFDYVALGHLHGPQSIGRETLRYSGSPLKYSFSEANQKKSITMIEFADSPEHGEKPEIVIREISLKPIRDMRIIEGTYDELMDVKNHCYCNNDDYIKAVLKDEDEIPYVMDKLRVVYPNIMALDYSKRKSKYTSEEAYKIEKQKKDLNPLSLFEDFYKRQNDNEMSDEKRSYIENLIEEIWEGEI